MPDDARQQIFAAAMQVFAEKGFAKASMNDIVRVSGLSKGGVYWHFASKDEIILAIVEGVFKAQMQSLDAVLSGEGAASERLLNLVTLIGASLEDSLEGVPAPIDIYAIAIRKPDLLARMKQYFQQYQTHFAELFREGVSAGEFTLENPERAAFIFMSTIEGILLISSVTQQDEQIPETLIEATHLFLRGIQRT